MSSSTPGDVEAFTERNKQYFDKMASTYDSKPWQQRMSAQILSFLQEQASAGLLLPEPNIPGSVDEDEEIESDGEMAPMPPMPWALHGGGELPPSPPEEPDPVPDASAGTGDEGQGGRTLADYQMQMMLLEQQNIQRLLLARQEAALERAARGESEEEEVVVEEEWEGVRLLDYACGTGLVTKALQPHITHALGIDISPAMVDRYNDIFSSSAPSSDPTTSFPPPLQAHAYQGDLLATPPTLTPSTSELANSDNFFLLPKSADDLKEKFDIAAVGLGFHHFHSPVEALKRLRSTVRRGGRVVIVDFVPFPAGGHGHGHSHGDDHDKSHTDEHRSKRHKSDSGKDAEGNAFHKEASETIKTHGFSEEDMERLFEEAELEMMGWRKMEGEVEMFVGKEERRVVREVFVAIGERMW